jgi:hypothetical protein
MLTMNVIAEWARQHPKTRSFWRLAGPRRSEVARAGRASGEAAQARPGGPRAVAAWPEPFAAQGAFSRMLITLLRQPDEGPRDRARARAHADRLVETIRVLSSL